MLGFSNIIFPLIIPIPNFQITHIACKIRIPSIRIPQIHTSQWLFLDSVHHPNYHSSLIRNQQLFHYLHTRVLKTFQAEP